MLTARQKAMPTAKLEKNTRKTDTDLQRLFWMPANAEYLKRENVFFALAYEAIRMMPLKKSVTEKSQKNQLPFEITTATRWDLNFITDILEITADEQFFLLMSLLQP